MVEGYKAYRKMPYDRPTWDMMSVLYVLRPEMFGCPNRESSAWTIRIHLFHADAARKAYGAHPDARQQDAVLRFFVRSSSKPAKYR
ncbi:MAG: hypothetical protein ACLRMJ_01690 [Alistipes finegoldii]